MDSERNLAFRTKPAPARRPDGGGAEVAQAARKKLGADPVAEWPRFGLNWREIRRITKRTQSGAERVGRRFCRRIFMDWLCHRLAKLEQERVSSGDSDSSRTGDPSAARVD